MPDECLLESFRVGMRYARYAPTEAVKSDEQFTRQHLIFDFLSVLSYA